MCLSESCKCGLPHISLPPPKSDNEWVRGGECDPYAEKKRAEQEARRFRLRLEEATRRGYYEYLRKKEAEKSSAQSENAAGSDGSKEPLGNTGDCSPKSNKESRKKARDYRSRWAFKSKKTDAITKELQEFCDYYLLEKKARKELDIAPSIDPIWYNVLRYLQDHLAEFGLGDKAIAKCISGIIPSQKYALLEVEGGKVGYRGACMCGSYNCPVCSFFKEMKFANELSSLAENWLEQGSPSVVIPAVLTFRHFIHQDPKDVMRKFKAAFKLFLKHIDRWFEQKTGVALESYAYAIESTGSIKNSWHHHINFVVFGYENNETTQKIIADALRDEWNKCLEKVGLGLASEKNGVRADIIRSVDDVEKLAKYLAKNSLSAVMNFALEMGSSRSKVGEIKCGVKRWTPFELLFDAYIHRDCDPERSKVHLELFVEYIDITHGLHMRQFSQKARAMLRMIEAEEKAKQEAELGDDAEKVRSIIGLISRDTFKTVREKRLFNETINLHKTGLSPQQITNVLLNIERLDKFLSDEALSGNYFNTISPRHYLSLVLAKEETDDLSRYLTKHNKDLNAEYLMLYAEPIDFQHYIENQEDVDLEYQKEVQERAEKAAKERKKEREKEVKQLIHSFGIYKDKIPKTLRVRFLTWAEHKQIRKELYRDYEIQLFELMLDNGISVSKFMRWLPKARSRGFNWTKFLKRYGKPYGDLELLQTMLNHWVNQPDLVIEAIYEKWEKRLCTPFDLRSAEQKSADAEAKRKERQERKAQKEAEAEKVREKREEKQRYTRNRKEFTVIKSKHWNRNGLCCE